MVVLIHTVDLEVKVLLSFAQQEEGEKPPLPLPTYSSSMVCPLYYVYVPDNWRTAFLLPYQHHFSLSLSFFIELFYIVSEKECASKIKKNLIVLAEYII